MKKIIKYLICMGLFICCYTGLYFFCNAQTQGFRPYRILSNLPNDPRWEVPPLSAEKQEEIYRKLNQSFTFLGSGGWCYAFLGDDQTTVLKFYKHTHLELKTLFKELSFKKLLFKSPPWPKGQSYFQEFNFTSCMLLYKEIPERTGLLHVHLNKTEGLYPIVTLIDKLGIKHGIALDKTEFVVQTKADLLIPHLDALMQQGEVETAKHCIREILLCLFEIYKKGLRDADHSFRNNFGYIENKAIALDLSSFIIEPTCATDYLQETLIKTKRLEHHLRKYYPVLHRYYQECTNPLSNQDISHEQT